MSDHLPLCPEPPNWLVAWDELDRIYPWIRRLAGCPQDAIHHAEGDVWIHTRMVCEALAALPAWRSLPDEERHIVFAAALLHDVGKPDCTRREPDGRISSAATRGAAAFSPGKSSGACTCRSPCANRWRHWCAIIRRHTSCSIAPTPSGCASRSVRRHVAIIWPCWRKRTCSAATAAIDSVCSTTSPCSANSAPSRAA